MVFKAKQVQTAWERRAGDGKRVNCYIIELSAKRDSMAFECERFFYQNKGHI